jgi:hypothetical protein
MIGTEMRPRVGYQFASPVAVLGDLCRGAPERVVGPPVLMQLQAKDHPLPHLFTLRAERRVVRYGVATSGALAGAVLLLVGAEIHRLLPVFAIGVFIGFTISQARLVRY